MKTLIIVLVLFNSSFINSFEKNIDSVKNDIMIDELYEHPKFKRWIDFWKLKIPEVEGFILEKTDTIERKYSSKINLEKWFNERELREFTLDFSPEKNYVADIYSHVGFEYKDDSIYVMGGDVDPSFVIINIKDSMLYYLTFGPYSFFDESIWLSDSTCYILGFAFDDSRQNVSEAYSKILILKWDFNKNSLIVSKSKKLPFKNELMSFRTYMDYLYPNFK
jgi:hypothetical protein